MELVKPVTIMLDKERHLKLTLGGMKAFHEITGKSFLKGFDVESINESELIALIWGCLLWEDRALKLEDVGFMLDGGSLVEIQEKLLQAIKLASTEGKQSPNL
jgi:hypothetical protein